MAHDRYIRSVLLLIALAVMAVVAIACESEQIQYYLTPTQVPPGHSMTAPNATEIVAATELPSSPGTATATPILTPTAAPTAMFAGATPDGFYTDQTQAEHAALDLGCTGWSSAKIDGTIYYRPCADDDLWAALIAPGDDPEIPSDEATATTEPDQPTSSPTAPPETSGIATPIPVPTQQPSSAPPPYHYLTEAEALAGAAELGRSGWSGTVVDGVSYFRACGSDRDYELLSSGVPVTLSG